MSTPFVILAIAFANGWIKVPVRWSCSHPILYYTLDFMFLSSSFLECTYTQSIPISLCLSLSCLLFVSSVDSMELMLM